jgi:hypothetical protein
MHVDETPGSEAIGGISPQRRGLARYAYTGRHHVGDNRWVPIRRLFEPGHPGRLVVATGVVCCIGYLAVADSHTTNEQSPSVVDAVSQSALAARAEEAAREASRGMARATPTPAPSPTAATADPTPTRVPPAPKKSPPPAKAAAPAPKPSAPAPKPTKPRPVAGLSRAQMDNAATIVRVGRSQNMATRALIIAVATAMQESNLYNLASNVLPESFNYPHQGSGSDHDSIGLFQQRPSTGWGTIAQIMRPAYAAGAFFAALRKVIGWENMSLAQAAQAVQVSAFPDAYAKHEARATQVIKALS